MIVDSTFHSVYISTVRKRGENMKTVDSTFHSVYISTNNKEVHVDKDVPLHSTLFILVLTQDRLALSWKNYSTFHSVYISTP